MTHDLSNAEAERATLGSGRPLSADRDEIIHRELLDPCAAFNCQCGGPIHSVMGLERCSVCGKLAGDSIFVNDPSLLPSKRGKRMRA